MEPWLDSLSEDWKSEHHSSSPAPSFSSSRQHGSVALSRSQSRIPHLANNMRKDSTTSSFLKHRSTYGKARQNSQPILRERSASSLNLPAAAGSQKTSSLPRRTSNAFSESQDSVQHHSIREKPTLAETPDWEWKRRLATGEDVNSDGFDLFSPSKLEGVFKQPNSSQIRSDREAGPVEFDSNRNTFNLPPAISFPEQYSSYRGTRSRINLEVLEEVNEEEELEQHSLTAVSSEVVKNGSLRGLVKQRVLSFERAEENRSIQSSPRQIIHESSSFITNDPRWRSASGVEELRNECISPVTVSKQNSIRNTVLRDSLDANVETLQRKLQGAASEDGERPTSSASDSYIDYARKQGPQEDLVDEPLPDLTSQSLPDDLSMGTQDFVSNGGFINSRRGGRSNEASFLRKSLSLSQEPSRLDSNTQADIQINSSPPLRSRRFDDDIEQSKLSASAPATPQETSIIHHTPDLRPASSRSPLKLFGNRDTYTNNKLMRILSQFEDPNSSRSQIEKEDTPEEAQEPAFRMSEFGQGDLDGFGFEQNVRKPSPIQATSIRPEDRIFHSFDSKHQVINTGDDEESRTNAVEHATRTVGPLLERNDRTTKRRRTVLKEQISLSDRELEVKISEVEETATLAGKKRKDARPGDEGVQANPETLASRDLLRPKSARKSSTDRAPSKDDDDALNVRTKGVPGNEGLTEALAAELATFAQEAAQVNDDSRKPSLATKDYMEEANKVMQFIRSRGKPRPAAALAEIIEPVDVAEINPDSILVLDLDAESTKDDFSRPPSRDRTPKPVIEHRNARHDSRTASYLRKYRDEDNMDALGSTSVFGTLPPANNSVAARVDGIAAIEEPQESDPPNVRILNQSETFRKRKYSSSTIEHDIHTRQFHSQHSSDSSTQHSFPTHSSASGHKGVISSGTVSIPDIVGTMTFDHEKKIWVKKVTQSMSPRPQSRQHHQALTEDDPFDSIPDLSIDEQRELQERARDAKATRTEAPNTENTETRSRITFQPAQEPLPYTEGVGDERDQRLSDNEDDTEEIDRSSLRSKTSAHEAKLHNGFASKPPNELNDDRRQARVVTIAFSSPVVSGINHANLSEEDFSELPREEDLPLDDSVVHLDEHKAETRVQTKSITEPIRSQGKDSSSHFLDQNRSVTFQPRTISPIVEDDEEQFDPQMSLVHVKHSKVVTPAPPNSIVKLQKTGNKASSILCLTPLSEFSVHQVDKVKDPDQSYVEERKHPHALRQAHGSLALAVDELIKAITDAAPDELFWDQMQRLVLAPNSVSSVHSLKEYCPVLEELTVCGNGVSQIGGLPTTLRILDIHNSMVNDLTAWSHLLNLQYLDVSGCQLENLDGFSSLVHLRRLRANNNRVSNIDGILDLDGLLELELNGNALARVDFEGCDLGRLQRLDLSKNQIGDIKNLNCLPALEDLNVSHNILSGFSSAAANEDLAVRKLHISHNNLEVIGLKHMPALQHLGLDANKIKDIRGLSSAYHLDFLSLREQRVRSDIVELVLTTPNECRHIRLSSNSVVGGSFGLPAMPQNNLRELEIAACGISELPERFGMYFPNCRCLNMNFNAIREIAPLRKMVHLDTLLLAKNRVQRLRRTCLVMSRLPSLKQIDLRDNPLTVGFYNPIPASAAKVDSCEARYHLPVRSEAEEITWMKVLDEVTGLKRRTIELLLAEYCPKLVQLDGLALQRGRFNSEDETWNKLTSKKVLVVPPTEVAFGAPSPSGLEGVTNTGAWEYCSAAEIANDGNVFNG